MIRTGDTVPHIPTSMEIESTLKAIREISEYQQLAADLIHSHGINFRNDSGVIGASQLSDLVLSAIAYGIGAGRMI